MMVLQRRRWCTFTLRALFVAMTVPALWFGYYHHWAAERREARRWIEGHKSDWSGSHPGIIYQLPWPLELLGELPEHLIWVHVSGEGPADYHRQIERLRRLFPEAEVFDGETWHRPTLVRTALKQLPKPNGLEEHSRRVVAQRKPWVREF